MPSRSRKSYRGGCRSLPYRGNVRDWRLKTESQNSSFVVFMRGAATSSAGNLHEDPNFGSSREICWVVTLDGDKLWYVPGWENGWERTHCIPNRSQLLQSWFPTNHSLHFCWHINVCLFQSDQYNSIRWSLAFQIEGIKGTNYKISCIEYLNVDSSLQCTPK